MIKHVAEHSSVRFKYKHFRVDTTIQYNFHYVVVKTFVCVTRRLLQYAFRVNSSYAWVI